MGWHSTVNLTVEASRTYARLKIDTMNESDLRDLMDTLLYNRGYNVNFVSDTEENEDNLLEMD